MCQYTTRKSKVLFSPFAIIQKYGKELEKFESEELLPGKSVYGAFTTLRKDLLGSGVIMLFWLDCSHHLNAQGIDWLYTRCSNYKTYKNMTLNGGEMLNYVEGK